MIISERTLSVGERFFREAYLSVLLIFTSDLSLSCCDSTGLGFALILEMNALKTSGFLRTNHQSQQRCVDC
ncbi:MAG: hypothetical protein ACI936_004192 [Paraglaciecola sp.]|jgi:hypothetical protein